MLRYVLSDEVDLRMLEEGLAPEMFEVVDCNREHLREWLPFVDATKSPADNLAFIRMSRKQFADNQGVNLGIFYKGGFAGMIGVHYVNWGNKTTSIGYWLGQEFTGKGVMTLAVSALLDHVFDVWKLNRAEIRVAPGNLKSQAIPKRLGFVEEGVLRQNEWLYDHYVDHIVFSMLADDWKNQ